MIDRQHFLGGAAALGAAAFPGIVRAQSGKALTIGYVPSTLFAPVFVAQERGYLKDAGFNATLTPIVAGQDAMALVAQSQMDVATAGLSAAFFNAINRNLEVKFVASTGYQPAKGHPTRADDAPGSLRRRRARREFAQRQNRRLARQRRRYVGILRGPDLAQVRSDDERHLGREHRRARPASRTGTQGRRCDVCAAPFTALFAEKKLAQIVGSAPAGIAGTGIFFGPTLLNDAPTATAVMKAFRRGAADVTGSGYLKPENLAAMAKYTGQTVDLIKTTDRYDFKPDLRIDQGTLLDMQNEFISQGILAYKTALPDAKLIGKF